MSSFKGLCKHVLLGVGAKETLILSVDHANIG